MSSAFFYRYSWDSFKLLGVELNQFIIIINLNIEGLFWWDALISHLFYAGWRFFKDSCGILTIFRDLSGRFQFLALKNWLAMSQNYFGMLSGFFERISWRSLIIFLPFKWNEGVAGRRGAVPELHFPFYSVLIIIIMKCVSLIDNKANLSVVSAMSVNTISSIDILAPVEWCCCNASTSLSGFACCASYRTLRGTATVCPLPRGNHSKNCGITTHKMKHKSPTRSSECQIFRQNWLPIRDNLVEGRRRRLGARYWTRSYDPQSP